MYNKPQQAPVTENLTDTSVPEFKIILERLIGTIAYYEKLSSEVNTKLQQIKLYSEPCCSEPQTKEGEASCFVDDLFVMINRIDHYNDRLSTAVRHLNTII